MKWIAILAAALLTACTQIDTGNVGVESTVGQVKPEVLTPGMHFTLFKTVTEVSGKEVRIPVEDLKPRTSDRITLTDIDVDLYVQIDPSKAPAMFTRWPGDASAKFPDGSVALAMSYITRQAREAIYGEVAKHKSETIHLELSDIATNVVTALQNDLNNSAGAGWFFVRSANVRTLVTDPALEENVKAVAKTQLALRKKELEIELARKEAERQRAQAQGEADSIRIKSEAVAKQGGDDYVRLQAIEKWDGKLPVTQAGGATPILNLK